MGISRDVSDRRRAEEALRQSEARYRAVVEQSVEGIFLFDPDTGRILESNAALREMLGYSSEEPLGMTVYEIVAHDRREVEASLREDLRHRRRLAGERRYRRKDGTLVEVEVGMTVVLYQGKEALCSVVRDLTERKRLERELRHQATHDPLTGLPNRTLFTERLVQALEREPETGGRTAMLCLDLDGFKAVNDPWGHEAGDRLLVDIAGRLLRSLRPGTRPASWVATSSSCCWRTRPRLWRRLWRGGYWRSSPRRSVRRAKETSPGSQRAPASLSRRKAESASSLRKSERSA